MNNKLILWSITVGLGGFLFGLDTAVISGAELEIQKLWNLDSWTHGLAVAIALYGTVIGAAFGGIPADKYGRKNTLLWIGILFFLSSVGAAIASGVNMFMVFRFIGGLSIGASSVVAPVYISEIAPPKYRGRMVISFQANIVFGILIAYVSNYLLQGGADSWRWMLGVVAFPSLLFSVLMLFTPETPRWLLLYKGDEAKAREVLAITEENVSGAVDEIMVSAKQEASSSTDKLFSKKYFFPLLLAFLFSFFNQASGINAVIYYAPRIFEMTGLGKEGALLSTSGIGVFNLIFTIIGWYLIDRYGRRVLMYIGSIGYIISLALIAMAFYNESYAYVPYYVFAFIGAHAIGQGSVIWVFISEIFPNSVRASGMAFGSLTHWVFAALIANFFPYFADHLGGGPIFAFFSVMMVFQLIYVWKMMPETKGVSLEDLQKRLIH
ncbi:sugar porter family MFS transporter [Flectobacillus roseus]|uniref:Sugar porter family MFS transporter n=1 Tax=Flectobacillus roseus TaxID=502259 RepID=A0ABT6Y2A3_9BACT|nr:sugar porter family MFS transporter [Flectobacillus roseus]MDI9857705.1 sugar porter family MFS transporter [Flectobacillus roseus]NBA77021.1 sugar porter family MFS transporter [Emticicia sp. ODNR4P]